ncbi:MAG: LacI family DNA-binding transcriptional regulator [Firmicutes bacterium]|nr:LacI family DNA-binding transcriptional regulator [Bacillota bacterium]
MGKSKRVTLDDISAEVGLSRFLVCRALTGKPEVNEDTRRRVQEAAMRLGYKNRKAKKTPEVISVVLLIDEEEANRVFWTRIIRGIEAAARNYGCDLLLRAVSRDEVERGEIPAMILEGRVKGVLITGNFSASYVARFEKVDCEVVLVDNYLLPTRHDAILIADWEGCYLLTKYLIKLGHQRLGYAGQISGHWSWTQRYRGFQDALLEKGLIYNTQYAIGQEKGVNVWNADFMDREIGRLKEMPTAWVCNNDLTAHYLIIALRKAGYKIPDDISIAGFDDLPEENPEVPALTTVRVFGQEMGFAAFEQLLWRLNNRNAQPRRILIGVQLIEGVTTTVPRVEN